MQNQESRSDICNSPAYGNPKQNTISLILFADGSAFRKSPSGHFWIVCSMIAELPPGVRIAYSNIVVHCIYGSSKPNLSEFFIKNSSKLSAILKNGITIDNTVYNIRFICNTGDSPARARLNNTVQYNGKYGCLHCDNPGVEISKSKRIYYYEYKYVERTNEIYKANLKKAIQTKATFEGVKGSNYFSKYLKIPEHCVIDPMHAIMLGTVKHIKELLFNKVYSKMPFYHGI